MKLKYIDNTSKDSNHDGQDPFLAQKLGVGCIFQKEPRNKVYSCFPNFVRFFVIIDFTSKAMN